MSSNPLEVPNFSGVNLQLLKLQLPLWRSYLRLKQYSLLLITMTDNSKLSLEIIWLKQWMHDMKTWFTGNPNSVLADKIIRCIYLPLFLCLYELFWTGFWIRSETVNITGYQMHLLVWHVVNMTFKFRLTFLILLTISPPLTTTRREKRQGMNLKWGHFYFEA